MRSAIEFLSVCARARLYWAFVLCMSLGAEAIALYYQHGLGEQPCVLCIHVRLWVLGFALLALVAMLLPRLPYGEFATQGLALIAGVGLLERSWQTWATEKLLVDGSCSPFLNLPDWFAVDRWLPELFEPRGLCGYTPEMLFGFTMADLLLAGAAAAVLLTITLLTALVLTTVNRTGAATPNTTTG